MTVVERLRKIALEPGVLFPLGNVFAFAQSGNSLAIGLAIVNVVLSVAFTLGTKPPFSPMRLTSALVFLSGVFALCCGAWLAGFAGLAFAAGNFFFSSQTALHAHRQRLWHNALTHPALYFGLGCCMTGVLAGGGWTTLGHPLAHPQSMVMVVIGLAAIIASTAGFVLNLFKSAFPFWILAAGLAINALAGLVVGNYLGVANCLFGMCGQLRLGRMKHQAAQHCWTGEDHGL